MCVVQCPGLRRLLIARFLLLCHDIKGSRHQHAIGPGRAKRRSAPGSTRQRPGPGRRWWRWLTCPHCYPAKRYGGGSWSASNRTSLYCQCAIIVSPRDAVVQGRYAHRKLRCWPHVQRPVEPNPIIAQRRSESRWSLQLPGVDQICTLRTYRDGSS